MVVCCVVLHLQTTKRPRITLIFWKLRKPASFGKDARYMLSYPFLYFFVLWKACNGLGALASGHQSSLRSLLFLFLMYFFVSDTILTQFLVTCSMVVHLCTYFADAAVAATY